MTVTPGYTSAEIREYVHQYHLLPRGTKAAWLAAQPFSVGQFRRWRNTVFGGDLDRNLTPRETTGMTVPPGKRTAFEHARAQEKTVQAEEVARLAARVRELEEVNEVLGKAIGLLHEMNVPEPAPPEATPARATGSS